MMQMSRAFLEAIRRGNIEDVKYYLKVPNLLAIQRKEAMKAAFDGAIAAYDDWDRNNFFQIFTLLKNNGCEIYLGHISRDFIQACRYNITLAQFLLDINSERDVKNYLLDRLEKSDYISSLVILSSKPYALEFLLEKNADTFLYNMFRASEEMVVHFGGDAEIQIKAFLDIVTLLVSNGAEVDQALSNQEVIDKCLGGTPDFDLLMDILLTAKAADEFLATGIKSELHLVDIYNDRIQFYIDNLIDHFLSNAELALPVIDFANSEITEMIVTAFKIRGSAGVFDGYTSVIARINVILPEGSLGALMTLLHESEGNLDEFESIIRGRAEGISIMPRLKIEEGNDYYSLSEDDRSTKEYYIAHPEESIVGNYLKKVSSSFCSEVAEIIASDDNTSDRIAYLKVINSEFTSISNILFLPCEVRSFVDNVLHMTSDFIAKNDYDLYESGLLGCEHESL